MANDITPESAVEARQVVPGELTAGVVHRFIEAAGIPDVAVLEITGHSDIEGGGFDLVAKWSVRANGISAAPKAFGEA